MIGTTLSHYKIVSEIGRGGMGVVYKAEDTKLDRTVAIKVLPSAALASDDDRERFYREAKAAAQLHHPNIASVFQIDEAAPSDAPHGTEPSPFIAMEYINGDTLTKRIADSPLKIKDAVRIAGEIASALEAAHEKNIVHRDIKSANVMITEKGVAKVLDFGLAKTAHSTMLTRMGSTLGTVAYMSPEQARGEDVDNRTDLWSLGVVLYEMITGRVPAPGDYEQAVVYSILNEPPEPLTALRSGVPMQLEWMVNKCLAKNPDERYQSAKGLLVDLKTLDLKGSGHTTTSMSAASMSAVNTGSMQVQTAASSAEGKKGITLAWPILVAVGLVLAVFGYLGSVLTQPSPEAPKVSRAHLIPAISGDARYSAVSPDGQKMAFGAIDSSTGTPLLHIYDFGSGETIQVGNSERPTSTSFSPDGQRIAFLSGGEVRTVPASGGDAVPIVSGAQNRLVWGPNRTIFYGTGSAIFQISENGGDAREIVSVDTTLGQSVVAPDDLLPGDQYLIYNAWDGSGTLRAVNVESGEVSPILSSPHRFSQYHPSGHLLIMPSATELRARPFDAKNLRFTGPPVTLFQNASHFYWAISESGLFIHFPQLTIGRRDYSYFATDGTEREIRSDEMDYEEFRISPSGRYIASEVNAFQGGVDQIIIFETDVGSIRPLTSGFPHYDPAWSPDESQIVSGGNERGTVGIRISNADGVGSDVLVWEAPAGAGNVNQFDWSPNGDQIAFKMTGTELDDIFVYSISEDSVSVLVENPGSQQFPRFSRDGRYVAYQSNELGNFDIFVSSTNGRSTWTVTTNGGQLPIWSTSGDEIYYARGTSVYSIPVFTEPVFSVTGQAVEVLDVGVPFRFDVHPDGEGFVISRIAGESKGYFDLTYNFGEYLKEVAPPTE